jgi:hypothetical protein
MVFATSKTLQYFVDDSIKENLAAASDNMFIRSFIECEQ